MLRPGDSLVVQALPALRGERFADVDEYEVVRDLPDPTAAASGPLARLARPVRLTAGRSLARRRLVRRGFDVAHVEMLVYQTDWADLGGLRRRVPLAAMVHDIRPHQRALPAPLETRLLRRTYRSAGHLMVFHRVLGDELAADFGVDPALVHVLPHPLDGTDLRDRSVERPDRPLLLFFGTLRPNKGLDVLLDAVASLGAELDADVVIAGEGDAAAVAGLRRRVDALPNVRLEAGRVPEDRKAALFSRASWVLLPYTSFHSQSGVLADAYAYRVPLVVSDVGALGPTVRDAGTGLVVPPGDADALAEALLQASRRRPAELSAALEEAARAHDHAAVGPRLRSIYDEVAGVGH